MPFINDILKYRSLSIVGLEKNTGKTVCLNYILRRLNDMKVPVGVTSIGVDGEQVDSVFATAKPEVTLYEGMRFITSSMSIAVGRPWDRWLQLVCLYAERCCSAVPPPLECCEVR